MRVKLDLEQSNWHSLLARCAEENIKPTDCINAWIRRAIRQKRTVMPGADQGADVIPIFQTVAGTLLIGGFTGGCGFT